MTRHFLVRYACSAALALAMLCAAAVSASPSGIASVTASDDRIVVTLAAGDAADRAELVAVGAHQHLNAPAPAVWQGTPNGQRIDLPRIDDAGRDRLFQRFVLRNPETRAPLAKGRFAHDLSAISATGTNERWPDGIKGIQDPQINQDMIELGVAHITDNISLNELLIGPAPEGHDPAFTYTVDGRTYAFREEQVRAKDALYRFMYDNGINVIGIILCYSADYYNEQSPIYRPRGQKIDSPMIHPKADPANMVVPLSAVNLGTEEGQRHYRAVMGFLAQRYSREDNKYGRLGGYVIGNEVNSHWIWHHMGDAPVAAVVEQYMKQVRLSYYAARLHNPDPRVFISLDHFWAKRHRDNALHYMPGKELLERFARSMRGTGDLPWQLAHHPYPENLFDPAFWLDETAWRSYDTPRITYKNVEVLVGYMQRPELRYKGEQRAIILSEQGFHAGETPESERLQAAAYALAHYQLTNLPGIDAHILHRHTDHPHEGGLLLGVRACDPEGRPTRKRLMFDVFAAAGTDRQDQAFAFALPIIGIASWDDAMPDTSDIPDTRPTTE